MSLLLLLTACYTTPYINDVPNWPCNCPPEESVELTSDTFVLPAAGPADVLLVVEPDPELVQTVIDSMGWLLDSRHRTGVVASTGGEMLWGDDPVDLLLALDASGPNTPLDASFAALEDDPDFRRPDADLHVLIATVSEDASLLTAGEWVDWMAEVGPAQVGLLAPDTDPWTEVRAAFPDPSTIRDFGLAVVGARREFFLSQVPRPGTLDVQVRDGANVFGFDEGEDYLHDAARNSVIFYEYAPSAGATVVVRYAEVDQDPSPVE